MEHLTASTSAIPFSGENWFDPLETAIRFRVRAFIEALVEEEAQSALGGRARYQRNGRPKGYRNGHRQRQLVGTFGACRFPASACSTGMAVKRNGGARPFRPTSG